MERVANKVLPLTGTDPNILAIQDGLQLQQVFWHTYQNCTQRDVVFWISRQVVGLLPSQLSQRNSAEWEEDCVLKRFILGAQSHPLSTTEDMTTEPKAKKRTEKASIAAGNTASNECDLMVSSGGTTQAAASLSPPTSPWWESGDAPCKKLFAPCTEKYESMECVKLIVRA